MVAFDWKHEFDFVWGKRTWDALRFANIIRAVHQPGIGWKRRSGSNQVIGVHLQTPLLPSTSPPVILTQADLQVSLEPPLADPPIGGPLYSFQAQPNIFSVTRLYANPAAGLYSIDFTGIAEATNPAYIHLGVDADHGSNTGNEPIWESAITKVVLYGLGTDPFPYTYDCEGAANYAIEESRDNFNRFPYTDPLSNIQNDQQELFERFADRTNGHAPNGAYPNGIYPDGVTGTVGGEFTYDTSSLLHTGTSTGSSIFLSEVLHVGGGFPMTQGSGDCIVQQPPQDTGWRICPGSGLGATRRWRDHEELIKHFLGLHSPPKEYPTDALPLTFETLYPDQGQNPSAIIVDYGSPDGKVLNALALYNLFKFGDLAQLQTGDYVFLELDAAGDRNHGFLIVGWGLAVSCLKGLNGYIGTDFTVARQFDTSGLPKNAVPFVADFGYGFDSNAAPGTPGRTGWLQDPRPRPFYASAATINFSNPSLTVNYSELGYTEHDYKTRFQPFAEYRPFKPDNDYADWQFIRMPNSVTFPQAEIYYP